LRVGLNIPHDSSEPFDRENPETPRRFKTLYRPHWPVFFGPDMAAPTTADRCRVQPVQSGISCPFFIRSTTRRRFLSSVACRAGTELVETVSSRSAARAYAVTRQGNQTVETALSTCFLGSVSAPPPAVSGDRPRGAGDEGV
jgi:hypothetical protein